MQSQGALSSFKPQNVARAVCPRARRKGVGALPTARWGRSSWTTMTTRSGAMTRRSGTRVRDDTRLERAHASQMRASDAGCPDLRVTRHHRKRRVRLASSSAYPPLTRPSPRTFPGKSTRCAARRRRARLRRSTRAAAARRRSPFADRTRAARPKVIRKKCKCLRRCARRFSSSPVCVARRRCSRAARISATRRASPPRRTKTTNRKAGARVRAGLSRRTRRESAVRTRRRRRRGGSPAAAWPPRPRPGFRGGALHGTMPAGREGGALEDARSRPDG